MGWADRNPEATRVQMVDAALDATYTALERPRDVAKYAPRGRVCDGCDEQIPNTATVCEFCCTPQDEPLPFEPLDDAAEFEATQVALDLTLED